MVKVFENDLDKTKNDRQRARCWDLQARRINSFWRRGVGR